MNNIELVHQEQPRFDTVHTRLELPSGDDTLLVDAHLGWTADGRTQELDLLPAATVTLHPRSVDIQVELAGLMVQARIEGCSTGWLLRASCAIAPGGAAVRIQALHWRIRHPLLTGTGRRCWHLPYNVWGCPEVVALDSLGEQQRAWWRAAIYDGEDEGHCLAASWALPADWPGSVHPDGAVLDCRQECDADLRPGELLRFDSLALQTGVDPREALAGPSAFRVARRRPQEVAEHVAWNSWDFHRLSVRAEDIDQALADLRAQPELARRIRYIVIDDGWQSGTGDWQPNEKFPEGMAALAGRIRAAGFLPGIWTAPFMADRQSTLGQAHPDWFVQHAGMPYAPWKLVGCEPPWGDRCMLDPTHPEVLDHIFQLYRRLYAWGFRYFKTDFLVNPLVYEADRGLEPPQPRPDREHLHYHDRGVGLQRAHRRCMQAIRAAIGEDSFWLGCGSLWATGAGLMDASRMSADIGCSWKALMRCAESVHWAGALHGAIWLNDPDFLVVRGPETATDLRGRVDPDVPLANQSHGSLPSFSADEARVWATLVVMSGGMAVLSDGIAGLDATGHDILARILPLIGGEAARPVDIEASHPAILHKRDAERSLLACINWQDEPAPACPREHLRDLPQQHWRDLWSGERLHTEALHQRLIAPHACLLLQPD